MSSSKQQPATFVWNFTLNYGGNDEEAKDDPWTCKVCDGRKKYNYPTCGRCYTAGKEAAAAAAGKPSATAAAPASEPEQQASPAATTDAAAAANATSEEAASDPAAPSGSKEPEDVGNGVAPEPAPEKS